jgi:hypothetical protein
MHENCAFQLATRSRHFATHSAIALLSALCLAWAGTASGQTNVAPGGTATQSSTDFDGFPWLAIDGNIDGWYPNSSVTHTDPLTDSSPWWEVNLGRDHQIDRITLWNRTDCCADRLYSFNIEIYTSTGSLASSVGYTGGLPNRSLNAVLPAGGVVGQTVRIELRYDAGNTTNRVLSLAEVEVFGTPAAPPPPPPPGTLPLAKTLVMDGYASQNMKTNWDGPKKTVSKVLSLLNKQSKKKFSKIPYQCGNSTGGAAIGRIRFDSDTKDRFQLADAAGNLVSGTFTQSGANGESLKLKADKASESSMKRMLLRSALDCDGIELGDDPDEQLLKMKVKLKSHRLRAEIKNGDTLHVTAKLKGTVKWKKKHQNKKIGTYYGSGKTTHKLVAQVPLDQVRADVPPACVADSTQGVHIYPKPGAHFEGWLEVTEIMGSDDYYMILSDDFISILEDFDDWDSVQWLLGLIHSNGVDCPSDARTRISIELSQFGKDNLFLVIDQLEEWEHSITAYFDKVEEDIYRGIIVKIYKKILGKIMSKIISTVIKAVL